jgi:hypothetical protein
MNRAPVGKKVLQYLAHAEGICLSGAGKYGHIEYIAHTAPLSVRYWRNQNSHHC